MREYLTLAGEGHDSQPRGSGRIIYLRLTAEENRADILAEIAEDVLEKLGRSE